MAGSGLRLTPHGRLVVEDQDDAPELDAATSVRLAEAFARGTGHGLVRLGAAEVGQTLPPLFVWWRDFAARYIASLCLHAPGAQAEDSRKPPGVPAPTAAELSSLVLAAPMMAGAEYLTQDVLVALWDEMASAFAASLAAAGTGLQAFLTSLNPAWNLVGRVHLLHSVPELERTGVVVRMPASWRASRLARPQVTATVGSSAPSTTRKEGNKKSDLSRLE